MPAVTVLSRPKGLPIATTESPTSTVDSSANESGVSSEAGTSTSITARSVDGSVPTSVAATSSPSAKRTLRELAPSTTCAFVTMCPSSSRTKPEPVA